MIIATTASCSTIRVTTDYDSSANFEAYKTFAFTDEALNLNIDELNRNRLLRAIETELTARGFTRSESPDVLLDLNVKTEEKNKTTTTTTTTPVFYGRLGRYYGPGYRYGYGAGFTNTQIDYETYIDGTLFIDMIDAGKKQLVWQGRGTGAINTDESQKTKEENINNAVRQIFMQYPYKN